MENKGQKSSDIVPLMRQSSYTVIFVWRGRVSRAQRYDGESQMPGTFATDSKPNAKKI